MRWSARWDAEIETLADNAIDSPANGVPKGPASGYCFMMARVFSSLAVAQLIMFAATAAIGLFGSGRHTSRHMLLAVFALLLSCLTQVALFTYFTVTGKMVVQAVHLGRLERSPLAMVKSLKRSATYCLALTFFSVLAVVITGATSLRSTGSGAVHLLVAGIAVAVHCVVFYRELGLILKNAALLGATLGAFERYRQAAAPCDEPIESMPTPEAVSTS